MAKTLNRAFENIPSDWQPQDGELFDIFYAYKKIGSCSLSIVYDQKSARGKEQFFPNSWFIYRNSEQMLPILEVTGLETMQEQKAGNGRSCLQAIYEFSKHKGCHGRMQVYADFGSAPFYEHCGFTGGNIGQNGLKYFDPTPQNLSLLFNKKMIENDFKLIPVPLPKATGKKLSETDKTLFEQMLKKNR